jgi:ubiquinone/menaquinone biosynthesis C-methylase UbiE
MSTSDLKPQYQDVQNAFAYDEYVRTSVMYQSLYKQLVEWAQIEKNATVLSLAAGTGGDARAAIAAGAAKVVCIDNSSAMIEAGKKINEHDSRLEFRLGEVTTVPEDLVGKVDVVQINAAGEYLLDLIYDVFHVAYSVLKPTGKLVFNYQADEIERRFVADPQRQLRRAAYLVAKEHGYAGRVEGSGKPSVNFFEEVGKSQQFSLHSSAEVKVPVTLEDSYHQLMLPSFIDTLFANTVPSEKKKELLQMAYQKVQTQPVDDFRVWYFFRFDKI